MKPLNIIVHHTASVATLGKLQLQAVNTYHKNKDWGNGARIPKSSLGWYVAYHYFIDTNGALTQCADATELRWHAAERNIDSIGVCLAGRFDKGYNTVPTAAQTNTLRMLLLGLTQKYGIPANRIYPHRKFAQKTCYGNNLPDDWASKLVSIGKKVYQILSPNALSKYKSTEIKRLSDGRIILNEGVKPVPNTVKEIYL